MKLNNQVASRLRSSNSGEHAFRLWLRLIVLVSRSQTFRYGPEPAVPLSANHGRSRRSRRIREADVHSGGEAPSEFDIADLLMAEVEPGQRLERA